VLKSAKKKILIRVYIQKFFNKSSIEL